MSSNYRVVSRLSFLASLLALGLTATTTASYGQTAAYATPRVLGPVSESQLIPLRNNVLPVARARVDRGAVPDGTPTGHLLMMLRRSDAQQKALDALIAAQKDPASPRYHKWLTPEQFGAQFGVADADVQAVASYLAAQGFQVGRVFKNKMAIEFSGTTGQVRSAFHTEIHNYALNGQTFHANAKAPEVPAALAPVIKGITLNNFKLQAARPVQKMVMDPKTGKSHPMFTDLVNFAEAVSPGDLAAIYDIPSTATGAGVTVGVVGDSNINLAIPANYRTLFGLPANAPTVIVDGSDPGVNEDAGLAYGQIELLAATAPQANVNYYTAASTDLDTGVDFAAIRAVVDNNVQVLLFGFESCESALGPDFNSMIGDTWQEAAAQGISVIVQAGSGGAAGCDAAANGAQPETAATQGLAVNGYASTPWDTAVGASDFYYGPNGSVSLSNPGAFFNYWNINNGGAAGFTSAKSYIPEQPWNASYTANNVFAGPPPAYVQTGVLATGGGVSTVGQTADDGTQSPYPQPGYQTAVAGGISTTARVIPDVSMFGSSGNNGSFYMLCIDPADCVNGTPDSLQYTRDGGPALAAASFAGVAALVVQAHGVQGNLNDGLYATAAATPSAFHDITVGTNMVACAAGSPDCVGGYTATTTPAAGPAYNATAGYDAASGLGSVDVAKLLTGWQSGTGAGTTTVTISITKNGTPITSFEHGDPAVQLNVTVTGGSGTATGDVALTVGGGNIQSHGIAQLTLDSTGTATWPYGNIAGLLPGGSYSIFARYAGNGTYAPTVASTPVTVSPVQGLLTIETSNQNGPLPVYNGQTVPYGTNVSFTFFVADANNSNDAYSATGSIALTDNGTKLTVLPLDSEGFATFSSSNLAAGSHVFGATYSGDSTFTTANLTGPAPSVVVGSVPTTTTLVSSDANPSVANSTLTLVATVTPNQVCSPLVPCPTGAAPGGKVRFKTGKNFGKVLGTVTLAQGLNTGSGPSNTAVLTLPSNTFAQNSSNSIEASYLPDNTGNYLASTSAPVTVAVGTGAGAVATTTTISTTPAGAVNFTDTSSLTFVATVAGGTTPTGTVTFFSNGTAFPPVALNAGAAAFTVPSNGDGRLSLPLGQSSIVAQYSGDASHAPSSSTYTVNVYTQSSTPDFAMQSDTTYHVIAKGSRNAKFTLQFTSMNNLAGLGIPITLTYTGPSSITCSGSPAAPKFGKSIYATVTYTCKPASGVKIGQASVPPAPTGRFWMAGGGIAVACIFLFGMPGERRRWHSVLGSMMLFVVAFGITGCGAALSSEAGLQGSNSLSSGGGTADATTLAPGSYTVIVTGTAAVLANSQPNTTVDVVHNLPLTIVVQ